MGFEVQRLEPIKASYEMPTPSNAHQVSPYNCHTLRRTANGGHVIRMLRTNAHYYSTQLCLFYITCLPAGFVADDMGH